MWNRTTYFSIVKVYNIHHSHCLWRGGRWLGLGVCKEGFDFICKISFSNDLKNYDKKLTFSNLGCQSTDVCYLSCIFYIFPNWHQQQKHGLSELVVRFVDRMTSEFPLPVLHYMKLMQCTIAIKRRTGDCKQFFTM